MNKSKVASASSRLRRLEAFEVIDPALLRPLTAMNILHSQLLNFLKRFLFELKLQILLQ